MGPILKPRIHEGGIPVPQDEGSLGRVLGRCTFLLFGILPNDQSRLTFVEVEPGQRYVEQSQLLSMKQWCHERIITPGADDTRVIDKLEFMPRFADGLTMRFVSRVWKHRDAVSQRQFQERRDALRCQFVPQGSALAQKHLGHDIGVTFKQSYFCTEAEGLP